MSSFRIRPRFKHAVRSNKEDLELRISSALAQEKQFTHLHIPDHICIKIHPKHRHLWSPQLDLSFEQAEDQVIVRGLYGPNPTLWALFFFSYVIIGIAALAIAMWGFSLWTLQRDPSVLWALPGLAVAAFVLYLISQTGQKLGAQQMFDLHHFYEAVAGDKVIIS